LGEWLHEQSGATVYWLKRKEGQRNYVEFDCAKCGDPFFCKDELPARAEWWGLCPECRYKHNLQRAKSPFGERIGECKGRGGRRPRLGAKVRVPCPFPGCGRTNEFHFETTRRPGFTGLCKPGRNGHRRDEIALFFLSQAQNGNGQKNGHSKQGRPEIIISARILEAVSAVAAEWEPMKNTGKSCEQQAARITQADLLSHLSSIKKKDGTYEQKNKRVSGWFMRWGLRDIFPDVTSAFDSFVQTVVAQLRDGSTEEQIASSLESLLKSNRLAA
jgi:hypothetical protein